MAEDKELSSASLSNYIKMTFEYYSEAISLVPLFLISTQKTPPWLIFTLSFSFVFMSSSTLVLSQTLNIKNCSLSCPSSRLVACTPKDGPTLVNLGVSDREVCHKYKDCYGGVSEAAVPVQQKPVSILLGQSLSLRLDQAVASISPLNWQFYSVTSRQFLACDIFTNKSQLVANLTHTSSFFFNSSQYGIGKFYFAGEANNILTCTLGLRIVITVKPTNCPSTANSICSGKGICIANVNNTVAKCTCCPGYNGTGCSEYDACVSNPCLNSGNCTDVVADMGGNFTCTCTPFYTGKRCETKIDYCDPMPCLNNATCNNLVLQKNYTCNCKAGFTGSNCEVDINECLRNNCTKNATCVDLINGYRCECNGNWTGQYCENDINECNSIKCHNNAPCVNTPGSFYCSCPVNVTGRFCETDLYDNCVSNPCVNNGLCADLVGGFNCSCPQGYTGMRCQTDINECLSNPCSVEGTSQCINGPGNYSCVCRSEYTGKRCEQLLNRCIPSPCLHGGLCVNVYGDYNCVCPAGYQGKNCQEVLNKCHYKPCKNNATCEQTGDFLSNYTCHCFPGWTGRNCTEDYNECMSNPCLNRGTCLNKFNKYECLCDIGWYGTQCQINFNACEASPCKNNATCTDLQSKLDYVCTCAPGFTGQNCSINVDDCVRLRANCNNGRCVDEVGSYFCNCTKGWYGKYCDTNRDMCASKPCLNEAVCENRNTTSGYYCQCKSGWTGANCGTNINDCASNPCRNGATCIDYLNYYNYTCRHGYIGQHCETEINECLSRPCQNNATCLNEIGQFRCNCLRGYTGARCEININDCASMPCFNNAACVDEINAYTCRCKGGYLGSHCEIPKCRTNPCRNGALCTQLQDRYVCNCLSGYTGQNCDVQINECASNPCLNNATCVDQINGYQCDCLNGYTGKTCETHLCDTSICRNGATCQKTLSGYSCTCLGGFTGQNCQQEINECLSNPCSANGTLNCTDLVNGYRCYCKGGYVGSRCENHTCDALKPCKNGAVCLRLPDRYQCTCQPGFTGRDCYININECASNPCLNGACIDSINGYTCNCSSMYTGIRCETNMDLCASSPCLNNASCTNNMTSLSYSCNCLGGYTGHRCEAHLCDLSVPCLNNATCLKLPHNYSCQCPVGFTGNRCEYDINECISTPCLNRGSCVNQRGSFSCICPHNFTGRFCETFIDYCNPNPCNNGTCDNNYAAKTFNCSCPPAFSGRQCQLHLCDLNNPCKNGASCIRALHRSICNCLPGFTGQNCSVNVNDCASSPCLNGGTCTDLINRFSCRCSSRYTGSRCENNVNYCVANPCRNSGSCQNDFANGTYKCICPPYATGPNCGIYLGPCFVNPCLNNGTCIEISPNSFNCSCPFGYNGTKCETPSCPCQNNGRCAVFDGHVKCICPSDYGGTVCERYYGDCRNNVTRKCLSDSFCVQRSYGYVCQCPGHLSGDTRCTKITTCTPSPCLNNAVCVPNGFASLECRCASGYAGQFCQFDINECASSPCFNGGQCREVGAGNFTCFCQARFYGRLCQYETSSSLQTSTITKLFFSSVLTTYTPKTETRNIHTSMGYRATAITDSYSATTKTIHGSQASPHISKYDSTLASRWISSNYFGTLSFRPISSYIFSSTINRIASSFVPTRFNTLVQSLSTFHPDQLSSASLQRPISTTSVITTSIYSPSLQRDIITSSSVGLSTTSAPHLSLSSLQSVQTTRKYLSSASTDQTFGLSQVSSLTPSSLAPSSLAPSSLTPSSLASSSLASPSLASPSLASSSLASSSLASSSLASSSLASSSLASSSLPPSSLASSSLPPSSLAPSSLASSSLASSSLASPSLASPSLASSSLAPSSLASSSLASSSLASSSLASSSLAPSSLATSSLASSSLPPSSLASPSVVSQTRDVKTAASLQSNTEPSTASNTVISQAINTVITSTISVYRSVLRSRSKARYESSLVDIKRTSSFQSTPEISRNTALSSKKYDSLTHTLAGITSVSSLQNESTTGFKTTKFSYSSVSDYAVKTSAKITVWESENTVMSLRKRFSFYSSMQSADTDRTASLTSFKTTTDAFSSSLASSEDKRSSIRMSTHTILSTTGVTSFPSASANFLLPSQVTTSLPSNHFSTRIISASDASYATVSRFLSKYSLASFPSSASNVLKSTPISESRTAFASGSLVTYLSSVAQSSYIQSLVSSPNVVFSPILESVPSLTISQGVKSSVNTRPTPSPSVVYPSFTEMITKSLPRSSTGFMQPHSTQIVAPSTVRVSSILFSSKYSSNPCSPNPCFSGGNCTQISQQNYNCSCPVGYGGEKCESLVCQCKNNGRCARDSVSSNYRCVCKIGFNGNFCENKVSDCRTKNCSGRGVCRERLEGFSCVCSAGYYGDECQSYTDNCVPNPCHNSGICLTRSNATGGGFTCACPQGHQGQLCQFDYNECAISPCLNGGTCREDRINSYTCYCPSWSYGANCESLRSTIKAPSSYRLIVTSYPSHVSHQTLSSNIPFTNSSYLTSWASHSAVKSLIRSISHLSPTTTAETSRRRQESSVVMDSFSSFVSESAFSFRPTSLLHSTSSDHSSSMQHQTVPSSNLQHPSSLSAIIQRSSMAFSISVTSLVSTQSYASSFDASFSALGRISTSQFHPFTTIIEPSIPVSTLSQQRMSGALATSNVVVTATKTVLTMTGKSSVGTVRWTSVGTMKETLRGTSVGLATSIRNEVSSNVSQSSSVAVASSGFLGSVSEIPSSSILPSPVRSRVFSTSSVITTVTPIRNLTCADRPCNGYTCYDEPVNGFKFRCECLYPSFGPRCIQGITIHFPYFNGFSYVEHAPIQFNEVINTVVMTFRTTNSNGMLLYAGHKTFRDFIMLRVVDGLVEFRFDAGAEAVSIKSLQRVDGGNLVTIVSTHDRRTGVGTLSVNASAPISRSSSASFKSIQLSTSWFLGGINQSFHPINSSNGLPTLTSLVGCIRDLQVNSKPYRVIDARRWLSIAECDIPACQRGPCRNNATCIQNQENLQLYTCQCGTGYLGADCSEREAHCQGDPCNGGTCVWTPTGHICLCQFGRHGASCLSSINITNPVFNHVYNYSSYIEYPWQQTMRYADERFEIRMQFTFNSNDPNSFKNGILAFAAQSTIGAAGDDFFAVGVINNYTYLVYNLGGGVASLRNPQRIDSSRTWHLIVAGRTGRSGYLYLDNQPATRVTSPGVLTGLDAYTPLYIGGVPDFSKLPSIVRAYFSTGFIGTIFDASFRTKSSNFITLLTQSGNVLSSVNGVAVERGLNIGDGSVNECVPNPCHNNGTCLQNGGQFLCTCTSGWTGIVCKDRRIPCIEYNPCAAGSSCQSNANGISCDCQLGKMGSDCNSSINITQPYFKENSFMGFQRPNVKYFTKVYLRFKTAKLDGLLFYLAERIDSSSGDYFAISLWNGYVYVRFNLGLGMATMRSRKKVQIGQWHEIYVERRQKEAIMRLDSNMYIGVRGSGAYTQLNVGSIVYLGGLPRLSALNPAAVKDVNAQRDFQGTVSHFIVNDVVKVFNATKAVVGRNIEDVKRTCVLNECKNGAPCSINKVTKNRPYACSCTLGWQGDLCDKAIPRYTRARFNGDGYIFTQDNVTTPLNENHIEFVFNSSSDGLLVWLGQLRSNKTDYLAVGIKNGKLGLSMDTGSGLFQAEVDKVITDGKAHKVIITRVTVGSFASIAVILNGFTPVLKTVTSADNALDSAGHIYIGGLDGDINAVSKGQYKSGLIGCIWDVAIRNLLDLNKNQYNRGLNVKACG